MARQPSTIDQLPDDIRQKLQKLLRDPRCPQLAATTKINAILSDPSYPSDLSPVKKVSKSAVNRYAMRMEEAGAKVRESREMAEMWIGELGAKPQGQVGNFINETLRTLALDVTLILQKGQMDKKKAPGVVKMLNTLALSQLRLEKAANLNMEREAEIRKQALIDGADAVEKAAVQQGMNAEQAAFWRQQVLGVQ